MGAFSFFKKDNATPILNKTVPEDFSFNGKTTKGALLYGLPPKGRKLADSSFNTLPLNNARCAMWSPSGRYLAVGHNGLTYLSVYYFDGATFTRLSTPATLPTAVPMAIEWSPNEDFFITIEYATPYFRVYTFDTSSGSPVVTASTTTTGTSVYTTNASTPIDASLTRNGKYLAVAQFASPYIRVWSMDGPLSTDLGSPSSTPGSAARACAWSPNGRYLAVTTLSSPYITVYSFNGSTLTKLANQPTAPAGTAYGVSWSPDGSMLCVSHETGRRATVYRLSSGAWSTVTLGALETNPLPGTVSDNAFYSGDGLGNSWSPDGRYLCLTLEVSPYVKLYSYESGSFSLVPDGTTLPTGKGRLPQWTSDGLYLAIAHTTSPGVSVYNSLPGNIKPGNMVELEPPSNLPRI